MPISQVGETAPQTTRPRRALAASRARRVLRGFHCQLRAVVECCSFQLLSMQQLYTLLHVPCPYTPSSSCLKWVWAVAWRGPCAAAVHTLHICPYTHAHLQYACAMRMPIFRLYACPYTVCISVVYMFTRRSSHASRRSRTRTARFAHRIARTVRSIIRILMSSYELR